METGIVKVVYEKVLAGQLRLVTATTPAGDQGAYVKALVGPGNKFWAWPVIPAGKIIGCNFDDAPTCSDDPAENNILIGNISVDPMSVLTYQT